MSDHLDRPVRTHRLTYLDDGDEVAVGRPATGVYAHLPADGAALLRRLADGETPARAADWYAREYGETVDMADFLDTMGELGFIAADGEAVDAEQQVRWRGLAAVVFSVPALIVYGLIVAAALVAIVRRPELAPNYLHGFFTESMIVVSVTLFAGQFPFLLLHEGAHALAGRRLGLPSRLRLSRRLFYIVMETQMDGLVTVPRAKRVLPILAGMITDLVVAAVLTLIAAATGDGLLGRLCLAFALTTALRLLWQLYFFLRTDMYYLAVTVLGCTNLHAVSRNLMHRRIARVLRLRVPDPVPGNAADHRAARWYSWLLPAGYAALLFSVVTVIIPSTWYVLAEVADRVAAGAPAGMIADSVTVAVLILSQFVIAGMLALREHRRRRLITGSTP